MDAAPVLGPVQAILSVTQADACERTGVRRVRRDLLRLFHVHRSASCGPLEDGMASPREAGAVAYCGLVATGGGSLSSRASCMTAISCCWVVTISCASRRSCSL